MCLCVCVQFVKSYKEILMKFLGQMGWGQRTWSRLDPARSYNVKQMKSFVHCQLLETTAMTTVNYCDCRVMNHAGSYDADYVASVDDNAQCNSDASAKQHTHTHTHTITHSALFNSPQLIKVRLLQVTPQRLPCPPASKEHLSCDNSSGLSQKVKSPSVPDMQSARWHHAVIASQ